MNRSYWRGVFGTRIGVKLALAVFVSIMLLEALVLTPSYKNYEVGLLKPLELVGQATFVSAFQSSPNGYQMLSDASTLLTRSNIRGGTVYRDDRSVMAAFGEPTELKPFTDAPRGTTHLNRQSNRLEAVWPAASTGLDVTIIGRMDISDIKAERKAFVWRIIDLALLISLFVCSATMTVFHRIVLKRLLAMRAHLKHASIPADTLEPEFIDAVTNDKLGEVRTIRGRFAALPIDLQKRPLVHCVESNCCRYDHWQDDISRNQILEPGIRRGRNACIVPNRYRTSAGTK